MNLEERHGRPYGRGSWLIDAFMAYAWVPQELAAPGTRLEISYFGRRQAGTVRPDALFDPDMTHIRR
ncbi:hypothetical protein [Arthrobacter mobilis]|uniref:Uncharacterized protein n=1 Tax=Arthrobacter mobilis TaxID=2724944 RepID=A0A7X6QMG7_9MICC|nr:hypothetical protein [Arthrobacter mobilis]NKX56689.1 hypothetical protein [Arthrobacter mobilis]